MKKKEWRTGRRIPVAQRFADALTLEDAWDGMTVTAVTRNSARLTGVEAAGSLVLYVDGKNNWRLVETHGICATTHYSGEKGRRRWLREQVMAWLSKDSRYEQAMIERLRRATGEWAVDCFLKPAWTSWQRSRFPDAVLHVEDVCRASVTIPSHPDWFFDAYLADEDGLEVRWRYCGATVDDGSVRLDDSSTAGVRRSNVIEALACALDAWC